MPEPTFQSAALTFAAAAKGLKALKDMVSGEAKTQAQVSDLYDLILSAQVSAMEDSVKQSAMIDQIRELKKQIADMKAWDTEKQRYQLANAHASIIVYALKKSMSNGELAHYLCANCYQNGQKSILQGTAATKDGNVGLHEDIRRIG